MSVELSDLPEVSEPLPWQQETWRRLGEQLAAGRLPHALLLVGAVGTGKSHLALALARRLLCPQPENGLNCGRCHACRLSAGGSHGDFRWVQPEEKSRVIKIDQVRQAVSFAQQTAGFGGRKVVVFYPADTMNLNAANALLKALEEPVPDTFLVLACHRVQGLPATVRSRCQAIRLGSPAYREALTWLQDRTGLEEGLDDLLTLADGTPVLAERLLRDGQVEALAGLRGAIHGVLAGRLSAVEAAALLADAEAGKFLLQLQGALHQLLRGRWGALNRGQARTAFGLDDDINRLRSALDAGANPNVALMVESLLARCERELGGVLAGDIIQG